MRISTLPEPMYNLGQMIMCLLVPEKDMSNCLSKRYKPSSPEDVVVVMVVGVEVVVEMLLLVTLAGRMGMLVRIFPTVLLQVIHQTFLKDWLLSLIGISLVIT